MKVARFAKRWAKKALPGRTNIHKGNAGSDSSGALSPIPYPSELEEALPARNNIIDSGC